MLKAERFVEGRCFRADRENKQHFPPLAPHKVLVERSCRFEDSLLHHAEQFFKKSSHFRTRKQWYTCYVNKSMLNNLPFPHWVWTTLSPIQVSFIRLVFWWICLSCLRIRNNSKNSYLGHRKPARESTTWTAQRRGNGLERFAREWCGRSISL